LFENENASNFKPNLERVTIALICNTLGEKLKAVIIGKSAKPRCFKNIDRNKMGINYYSSSKGWMTIGIFHQILEEINSLMVFQNRNIILLIDNASSHGLLELSNVRLVYFPKNCTSLIQPLDMGIIKSFKSKYRRNFLNHIYFRNINDVSVASIKYISLLEIVIWVERSWSDVSVETIQKSFIKAGLCNSSMLHDEQIEKAEDETLEIESLLKDNCSFTPEEAIEAAERFIIYDENCITENNDVDIFVQIVNDIEWNEANIDEPGDEQFVSAEIIKKQLESIRDISTVWCTDYNLLKKLSNVEQELKNKLKAKTNFDLKPITSINKQRTLDEMFLYILYIRINHVYSVLYGF